jgi:hypothetical protein
MSRFRDSVAIMLRLCCHDKQDGGPAGPSLFQARPVWIVKDKLEFAPRGWRRRAERVGTPPEERSLAETRAEELEQK